MKFTQYNYNASAYENVKSQIMANRLAQNRWGKKFKKLYTRHMDTRGDGTIGNYDFTSGMRALVQTVPQAQEDLAATEAFKDNLLENLQVDTGSGFRIDGALSKSYASVLIEAGGSDLVPSRVPTAEVKGVHFSLSLEDGTSWFHSSGPNDGIACVDYENEAETGEHHNTILSDRGTEDRENIAFREDQDARFDEIWSDLTAFLGYMSVDFTPPVDGVLAAVVIPLSSLIAFLDNRVNILNETIDDLENGTDRATEDLELITFLGIEETLSEEITHPNKIGKISFVFEKEITPTTTIDENGDAVEDEDYHWWEEEQFQPREVDGVKIPGIADEVKNFQDYCVREGNKVRVKLELLDKVGYKIYWFVNAFLDIDVDVKKASWARRIFNFIMLVVAIVLVVVTENPVWLKMLLITTSIMGYMGVLSPELSLLVAIVSFGYGLSQVNFSTMSSMQIFSWTIRNIEMVGKMLSLYENIGIQKDAQEKAKEKNKNKNLSQMQDEAMEFIYSRAYSQYDDLYNILYDFTPKYKT